MRKDHFTEEALKAAQALADLKYSESEEDQLRFSEAYDFARCQRPDGSFYGTSGQCRKGTRTGDKVVEPKATRGAPKPGSPAAKAIEAARQDVKAERGAPKPGSPAAKAIKAAKKAVDQEKTAAEMKANRGAYLDAKKEASKAGPHAAQLKELKSAWKDRADVAKTRKAEFDRVDRAFKMQQKKVKEDPSRENKERLKRVRTALIQEERAYNRAEREAQRASDAYNRLNKRNERAKMNPAQRKEAARIDRMIRELG